MIYGKTTYDRYDAVTATLLGMEFSGDVHRSCWYVRLFAHSSSPHDRQIYLPIYRPALFPALLQSSLLLPLL